MLRRGFWLYVWRVVGPDGGELLYVGRTGDSSSPNAAPAFTRMSQHLSFQKASNALRRHLTNAGIEPEACRRFDMIAHGPVEEEVSKPDGFRHDDAIQRKALMQRHRPLRDRASAMEKRLCDDLVSAGYTVLNKVASSHILADEDWYPVRRAFAAEFPRLGRLSC